MNRARAASLFRCLGLVAALSAASLANAGGAQGGTITFVGSIVAPGYAIDMTSATGNASSNTIRFSSVPNAPSSLSVRAVSLDGTPIAMRCTRASTATTSTSNRCSISGAGGAVELQKKVETTDPLSKAILIVSYN